MIYIKPTLLYIRLEKICGLPLTGLGLGDHRKKEHTQMAGLVS